MGNKVGNSPFLTDCLFLSEVEGLRRTLWCGESKLKLPSLARADFGVFHNASSSDSLRSLILIVYL